MTQFKSDFLRTLSERGFVHQISHPEELDAAATKGGLTAYIGFDATATVEAGRRYRWTFDNQSADPHPVHLHRHTFELMRVDGRPTRGLRKDVVIVPAWKQVEVDVTADQPGLALFHCHQQFHMDMGFMTMMRYST